MKRIATNGAASLTLLYDGGRVEWAVVVSRQDLTP